MPADPHADAGPDNSGIITYAIGDVHGRLDLLDRLIEMVTTDARQKNARARIVFTGDYCDRGPDSHGVVERLMAGPNRSVDKFICLRGNHDDLFVRAVTTGEDVPDWAWYLFQHTLESYENHAGPSALNEVLMRHTEFLSNLPLTYDDGKYLFVHAGIRPGIAIAEQAEEDLLWIRSEFLDYPGPLPRRVVHGHTIMGDHPVVTENRISIDTGAYRSGILTAAVLADGVEDFLQVMGAPHEPAIERERVLSESMSRNAFTPELDRVPALLRNGAGSR